MRYGLFYAFFFFSGKMWANVYSPQRGHCLRPKKKVYSSLVYWEHSQEDEWLEDSYIRPWWGLIQAASLELQKNLQVILPAEDLPFKPLFILPSLTLGECESYNFPCWISLVFWVLQAPPPPYRREYCHLEEIVAQQGSNFFSTNVMRCFYLLIIWKPSSLHVAFLLVIFNTLNMCITYI